MANGKNNISNSNQSTSEMTRPQALAVSWTGLEWLAKHNQLIICNDKTDGIVWLGIANAKVLSVGKDKDGHNLYDLVDVISLITLANTANAEKSVGKGAK
jgi:hypothetical protein